MNVSLLGSLVWFGRLLFNEWGCVHMAMLVLLLGITSSDGKTQQLSSEVYAESH